MLNDSFGRTLTYARLAVTDKCNLRCTYCMPEEGLKWLKNSQLLSTSEWKKMLDILATSGITKIRFTGGEPTSRGDFFEIAEHAFQMKAFLVADRHRHHRPADSRHRIEKLFH